MPTRYLIRYIKKTGDSEPEERILAFGGLDPCDKPWTLTYEEAVNGVVSGEWSFYVLLGNVEENLVVSRMVDGRQYLAVAPPHGQLPLLSLPPFPDYGEIDACFQSAQDNSANS